MALAELRLAGGERILDVGSGLGQLTRAMAQRAGRTALGIERSSLQLGEARRLAQAAGEEGLTEFRQGPAEKLPLAEGEWGTFDVVHTRFLLEHVPDPAAVVQQMVRAARPGGRIILMDDTHDTHRLWLSRRGCAACGKRTCGLTTASAPTLTSVTAWCRCWLARRRAAAEHVAVLRRVRGAAGAAGGLRREPRRDLGGRAGIGPGDGRIRRRFVRRLPGGPASLEPARRRRLLVCHGLGGRRATRLTRSRRRRRFRPSRRLRLGSNDARCDWSARGLQILGSERVRGRSRHLCPRRTRFSLAIATPLFSGRAMSCALLVDHWLGPRG